MSKYDETDAMFYKTPGMTKYEGIMRIIRTDIFTLMNHQFYDVRDEMKVSFSNFEQEIDGRIRLSSYLRKVEELQLPEPVPEFMPEAHEYEVTDVGMSAKNRVAWRLFKQGMKKEHYMEWKEESVRSLIAARSEEFEVA